MGEKRLQMFPSRFELVRVKQPMQEKLELGFTNEKLLFYSNGRWTDEFYYAKLCLKYEESQVALLSDGLILYLTKDRNAAVIHEIEIALDRVQKNKKTKKRDDDSSSLSSVKRSKGASENNLRSLGGVTGSASRVHQTNLSPQVYYKNEITNIGIGIDK